MKPDFDKYSNGLVPAIVQDHLSGAVLMLGYMNEVAWKKTLESGYVTFFSRSKSRLWTKGETSGNVVRVKKMLTDCDRDCLLISAEPSGPVCHTGTATCFDPQSAGLLQRLEETIAQRKKEPAPKSYTSTLFSAGIAKIAQKVGEEAVELVIESMRNDDEKFLNEAADLLYHFLVLLQAKDTRLRQVLAVLENRQSTKASEE